MKVLVTAGSTETDIDCVRNLKTIAPDYDMAIGNAFRGATGLDISIHLHRAGNQVTLLTSDRDIYKRYGWASAGSLKMYRTYDELKEMMEREITAGQYDVVIHSSAVSDYYVSKVMIPILTIRGWDLKPVDNSTKISSSHKELYLEMIPTEKLVDKIRSEWGFKGKLVKFKLQSNISDEKLIEIAKESMKVSGADLMVANCREWYKERAYIIGTDGLCENVSRNNLAGRLHKRLSV